MGYRIVAVNPLENGVIRPFPLLSFGLANITSKEDAERQIRAPHEARAKTEERNVEVGSAGEAELIKQIKTKYRELAYAKVAVLEERWPAIEPALKAHLERQKRRLDHFQRTCRLLGCRDPKRASRKSGGTRKNRRGTQHFCGPHAGLRGVLPTSEYGRLASDFKMRVELTA